MEIIYTRRVITYLANNGVYPIYEGQDCAYYSRTPLLSSLLDRFQIEKLCIPNKL